MKALKNFSIYLLSSLFQSASNFFLIPIYIRYLTPSEYGVINIILVFSSILSLISNLGVESGFYRLYYDGPKEDLLATTILWRFFSGFLFFILIFIFSHKLSYLLFKSTNYYIAIIYSGIFLFIFPIKELFFLILRLEQEAKRFFYWTLIFTFFDFGLKFIWIVILKKGVNGFWLAHTLSYVIIIPIIFLYFPIFSLFKRPNLFLLKNILKIGFPYTFSSLGNWIVTSSDKLLLNFFIGSSSVGVYTLAIKISAIYNVVLRTPVQLWFGPFALEKASKFGIEVFRNTIKKILNIIIFLGILLIPIITLLGLLIGFLPSYEEYKKAIPIVPFCIIPLLLENVMSVFGIQFIQAKKTKYAGIGGISASFISLLFNFLFIPFIGIYGAIISSIVTYSIWLVIYFIGGQKSIYIKYEVNKFIKSIILLISYELMIIIIFVLSKNFYLPFFVVSMIFVFVIIILNYKSIFPYIKEALSIIRGYI